MDTELVGLTIKYEIKECGKMGEGANEDNSKSFPF